MRTEHNDKASYISYTQFEIEIARLWFGLYGGSTEYLHEQKTRWEYIQWLKKLAQEELKHEKDSQEALWLRQMHPQPTSGD